MTMKSKIKPILALMLASVFLFHSCMTILHGTSQKIPMTSYPLGAKIIVDGKEMGSTPLIINLKKKRNHDIRIEKEGYHSFGIIITRKSRLLESILLNWLSYGAFIGGIIAWELAKIIFPKEKIEDAQTSLAIYWIGAVAAVVIDSLLGSSYSLSPKELEVTLSKIEDKSKANFILIDEEQLQNIKWIRVRSAS
jgi:hypothetical protein